MKSVASSTPRWCRKLKYKPIGIFHDKNTPTKILFHFELQIAEEFNNNNGNLIIMIKLNLQFGKDKDAKILSRGTTGVRKRISLWPTRLSINVKILTLKSRMLLIVSPNIYNILFSTCG
jgi:hypothetical protein